MKVINGENIGNAWLNGCKLILNEGKWQKDEYGNKTIECINLSICVENPMELGDAVEKYADKSMISFMKDNFLSMKPVEKWGYSYGQRIFSHNGVNQFEEVVKKLSNKPESRSATIDLMDPKMDAEHIPCACVLDVKVRDEKVVMSAFFRSQDIGKKFYADVVCCSEIMKMISEKIGKKTGNLKLSISSAHIYETDIENVKKMLSGG
jgi:thymidylate synthase